MADQFEYFKFQNSVNPFGIIFNPISIKNLLSRIVNQQKFTEDDVFFHNERWHCFECHSDSSAENKETLIQNLNRIIEESYHQLKESTHIIITFGTAWVYRHKASHSIVANCHKMPQLAFEKELLTVVQIQDALQESIQLIQSVNPNANLIFTVSPVRHLKDGFTENQRSKAHLIAAIHEIIHQNSNIVNYFPSYEILLDELRDYRFYAEDLLHPNATAIAYIWERFSVACISENAQPTMDAVNAIQKGLAHRPFNPNAQSHQDFLSHLQHKMAELQKQFPHMHF
jgi:lysophospholipase L1-like esterase